MKKKLLALSLGICLVAGCLSGCADYDYVPVDTETDIDSDYERLTEHNIINSGTYAERLSVVYDLAIKAPGDTKYHSVSVSDNILIPVSTDLSERTQTVEDKH